MEQEPTPEEIEQRSRTLARRLLTTPHVPHKAEPKRPRQKSDSAISDRSASRPAPTPHQQES